MLRLGRALCRSGHALLLGIAVCLSIASLAALNGAIANALLGSAVSVILLGCVGGSALCSRRAQQHPLFALGPLVLAALISLVNYNLVTNPYLLFSMPGECVMALVLSLGLGALCLLIVHLPGMPVFDDLRLTRAGLWLSVLGTLVCLTIHGVLLVAVSTDHTQHWTIALSVQINAIWGIGAALASGVAIALTQRAVLWSFCILAGAANMGLTLLGISSMAVFPSAFTSVIVSGGIAVACVWSGGLCLLAAGERSSWVIQALG